MKTVLSTKILTPSQKELFLNSGLGLVEYNALKIEFLDVEIPLNYENYIFTSKNAVKAFLNRTEGTEYSNYKMFCVGEKTKRFLEENGLKVSKVANNSSDLAHFIAENHQNEGFLFVCGNLRREELPQILSENNVQHKEVEVYQTHLNAKQFSRNFDGLLFYSPSGVRSYIQANRIAGESIFCIGETTAAEASKYSNQIIVANKPTVENVLVQAIKEMSLRT
ncbi:uroporphyrinogen-III synthase [Flagellimonas iocasae]|uniref:Uroporphyrinogen-III synthase n=1 Tax=Flagellimonas iocasae TaxID=2055905 RepID=A0ABW4XXU0_9FLAO